jgi:hydroxyethylthiazole kinase-like uncharacterized protein yjeF
VTLVPVATGEEAGALDRATIEAGVPSRALMQRAGAAAASEIVRLAGDRLRRGVLVLAGPGNNGGDAWVVARALSAVGARVRVVEPMPARTADCIAERALALPGVERVDQAASYDGEGVVVDGLLGTGAAGAVREPFASCLAAIRHVRERDAVLVALDLPSGLDATTGAAGNDVVVPDLTVTFGTLKRAHLVARGRCGRVVVMDIGLAGPAELLPRLVDDDWARQTLPPIPADAHKGTRKKIVIIGGDRGMAGAAILASRAAHRSDVGMVRVAVHAESLTAVQQAEPSALASTWEDVTSDFERLVSGWADAVVVGPGLGRTPAAQSLLDLTLARWGGPVVLDADALNAFEGRAPDLARAIGQRSALLTPHVVECARLMAVAPDEVSARRFDIGGELAERTGSAVLLKGVPTVVSGRSGRPLISATGTPALATAGSGDVLAGIAGALIARIADPVAAGALAAHVHGRAAERAGRGVHGPARRLSIGRRGVSLDDVIDALRGAWSARPSRPEYPRLVDLPAVGVR